MRGVAVAALLAWIAFAAGASGCSGSKFTAGTDAGTPREGGVTDASVADVATDASADGGGTAFPSPCVDGGAAAHQLCDDFDTSLSLRTFWTRDPSCVEAVVDSHESASPPNALLAAPPLAAGTDGGTKCVTAITTLMIPLQQSAHCEFDVREDGTPSDGFGFFSLSMTPQGVAFYQVSLLLAPGLNPPFAMLESLVGLDGGLSSSSRGVSAGNGPPDLSQWHHVTVQLNIPNSRQLVVTFDQYQPTTFDLPLYQAGVRAVTVSLGILELAGVTTTVRHDNIVCDVK